MKHVYKIYLQDVEKTMEKKEIAIIEEKVRDLSQTLTDKLLKAAKIKREKQDMDALIKVEHEIINLRREIFKELQRLSIEKPYTVEIDE